MPIHLDALALVARITGGDAEAAEEFVRLYRPRLEYIARRSGIPHQDCEDVAQDALLVAVDQMQRGLYRGQSGLGTWLEKIVRGKIAGYWRSRQTQRVVPLEPGELGELVSRGGSVAGVAVDQDMILAVHQALHAMPAQHRIILLLNRVGGYTIEDISHGLGMTMGQVSSRLYKAEEMFRRALRGDRVDTRMIRASNASAEENEHG